MHSITITENALEDLRFLKKSEQAIIIDSIEIQLQHEPTSEARNRKKLRRNDLSKWELRIQKYRVFYDVDSETKTVKIKAVGKKDHNILLIRKKEFEL